MVARKLEIYINLKIHVANCAVAVKKSIIRVLEKYTKIVNFTRLYCPYITIFRNQTS